MKVLGCSEKCPKIFCANKSTYEFYCSKWVYRPNFRALRVKLRELGCFKNVQKKFLSTDKFWYLLLCSEKWRKIFCANKCTFEFYCCEWVYRPNFRAVQVKLRELGCFKKWPKMFFYQQISFGIYCCEWVNRANFRGLRVKIREIGCSEKWP